MKKILLIICCFLLCGCNYVEVENLDIVSSIAIDYKDSEYLLKLEVITEKDTKIYDGKGKTLSDAFESVTLSTQNKIYLAHLDSILFTKNIDLKELAYYFLNEDKVNATFYLLLTDSIDVYSEDKIGVKIYKILENHNVYNFFHIASLIDTDKDFILPFYKDKHIESGYLFNDSKATLEVPYETVEIYKILDNIDGANLVINDVDLMLKNINTKISYDNKFYINIYADIDILDNNSDYDLSKKEIRDLENLLKEEIKIRILEFINLLKKEDIDLYGFNNILNSKKHSYKDDWKDKDFEIKFSGHISKKGLLR